MQGIRAGSAALRETFSENLFVGRGWEMKSGNRREKRGSRDKTVLVLVAALKPVEQRAV